MSAWSVGYYEYTAVELLPASERLLQIAAPQAGEDVLDVACGTGNAALMAAARGARVLGVDLASRLIEVARNRAAAEDIDVAFRVGDACALPVPDDAFDCALSVFGVIFAQPAQAAVAELVRVVRPGGRIVLTSWLPRGPLMELAKVVRGAVPPVDGAPPPTDWGNPDVVSALFAEHGASVSLSEELIVFRGDSPQAVVDQNFAHHPMWLAAGEAIGEQAYEALREPSIAVLEAHNEDPGAWAGTSPYLAISVTVPG